MASEAAALIREKIGAERDRAHDRAENLAASLRARDTFVSLAAHELRTPLTALSLNVQLMDRSALAVAVPVPAPLRAHISTIRGQVGRLEQLVRRLLSVSQMLGSEVQLELEDADFSALVADGTARWQPHLARAGCSLTCDLQPGVRLRLSPQAMEELLAQLLGNVAKFAPNAAAVVRLRAGGGAAILDVEDSGPGIEPAQRGRLFERFERGGSETTGGGWGLGLWLCKRIVTAHAGTIAAVSGVAGGTRIVVTVPCMTTLDLPVARPVDGQQEHVA